MWHTSAITYVEQNDYQEVAKIYEEIVENNPTEIEHYWYLGLAYLLQGLEEEAHLTWFTALNDIPLEEIDDYTQNLVNILIQEVERQLSINNLDNAWLIRSHIRELSPENYENLLELICLDIQVNNFDIDKFENWHIQDLFSSLSADIFSTELLLKSLKLILFLPCPDSLFFARFCLSKSENFDIIIAEIINSAVKAGYSYRLYGIDLLNICLEICPNHPVVTHILPNILNAIYVFAGEEKDYETALKMSFRFLAESKTLSEKIFANYQILYTYLKSRDFDNVLVFFREHKKLLQEFINHPEEVTVNFVRQSWLLINQPRYYIQDNPRENRYFINYISRNFQSFVQEDYRHLIKPYSNSLSLNRPLKIGYIAHTLKAHSVGWLSRWLVHYQDQNQYPCYLYNLKNFADEVTVEWFKKKAKGFYLFNQDIKDAIRQIQEDEIDILIDLDSLTFDLTCQVMALKPAPIQVTWLGMDASGIPNIDYFIADPYVLPDEAKDYYAEKIWRLPETYLGIDGFEVGIPTLTRENLQIEEDAVIFMNVQGPLKLNPDILRLQMKIIKSVPNSYLLLKGESDQQSFQQLYTRLANEEEVSLDRLRFIKHTPTESEHRANITIADVVLDTYPYNGSTTTLETLWMEVPIVTKVGEQFAARNSYTYMMNAGITEGIAWSDEEYIEWGIKLGTDESLRKEISWKLKQSKKTSPLWNGKQFAREMEKAYRQMWEIYVAEIDTHTIKSKIVMGDSCFIAT